MPRGANWRKPVVYKLKGDAGVLPADTRWKITGRFDLRVSARETLKCVRVHCYVGAGLTIHFAEAEFNRVMLNRSTPA